MAEVGCICLPKEEEEAEIGYARVPGIYNLMSSSDTLNIAFQSLVTFIRGSDR